MKYKYLSLLIVLFYSVVLSGQDSLNMVRLAQWAPSGMPSISGTTYNDIWGYTAASGEEYAIIGNVDSILVLDVTDCANPQRVYGFDGGNRTIWRDFKTYNEYLYAVCDNCNEGLHIFDMSGLPGGSINHVLSTTAFFTRAHNIYIDTATAKLYATGSNIASEGLVILDLSTPDNPQLIDNIDLDDEAGEPSENFYVHDIYVRNDTAYASHGFLGYYVWELSNLNAIEILGSYDSPGYNHSSWTDPTASYSYFAEEVPLGRPMAVMDLANLGDPVNDIEQIHTFKDPISGSASNVTPHNPFIKNDTLYISYYEDGIKVYDLSNPALPSLAGYYDTYPDNGNNYNGYDGSWGCYPFLDSGCLLVSDTKYGLNTVKMGCGTQTVYYLDVDKDGFGSNVDSLSACTLPNGYVLINGDCDDTDSQIFPGAVEICDDLDNDCDGMVDEECYNIPPCDGDSLIIQSITMDSFYAKSYIQAMAEIMDNIDIRFAAGLQIDLISGFTVEGGSSFEALIEDCDDSN